MNGINRAILAARVLGPRWAWRRAVFQAKERLGFTRRTFASRPWNGISLSGILAPGIPADEAEYAEHKREQNIPFFFPLGIPPALPDSLISSVVRAPSLAERIDLITHGRFLFFGERASPTRTEWYTNPFDGCRGDADSSWCDIPDFAPKQGDIRLLWEPGRAAWAVDLARAHAREPDRGHADAYQRWLDSWMEACPPFNGVHWKSGQEAAIRFLSAAIGFWALTDPERVTAGQWVQFARLAWATGYRIHRHIDYAISQRNNHALSEAFGLLLIAHLFPEFVDAELWERVGRRVLSASMADQFFDDGSYIQHSFNYHRVALQIGTAALRIGEIAGKPFTRALYERLLRSAEFLYAMVDPLTGEVPRYGHNDGSLVLPFTECRHWDFRPAIQAAYFLCTRRRAFSPGPWDEEVMWLLGDEFARSRGPDRVATPMRERVQSFDNGGYYLLRGEQSHCMIRCHEYRTRPGQRDALHLDLWWRGVNVLRDCGTYLYYDPRRPDVANYFQSLAAHNTVQVDNEEPCRELSRFLWHPWPKCRGRAWSGERGEVGFSGIRRDYAPRPWNVLHRRSVIGWPSEVWLVVDDLLGYGEHGVTVRWHLPDAAYSTADSPWGVRLELEGGAFGLAMQCDRASSIKAKVIRGRDSVGDVQGWSADQYGQRIPCPTLEFSACGSLPMRIVSAMAPGDRPRFKLAESNGEIQTWTLESDAGTLRVDLSAADFDPSQPLHREAQWTSRKSSF